MTPLTLKLHDPSYAVVKLARQSPVPPWAFQGEFFSLTITPEEIHV